MALEREGIVWSRDQHKPPKPRKNGVGPDIGRDAQHSNHETPHSKEEFVPWSWAEARLRDCISYWFSTVSPDGLQHTIPAWGVWHANALYFGSHIETRWNRMLLANSTMSVHLEKGAEVLTLEGTVGMTGAIPTPVAEQLAEEYVRKYGGGINVETFETTGCWVLHPRVAHGWRSFPKAVTRWRFPAVG